MLIIDRCTIVLCLLTTYINSQYSHRIMFFSMNLHKMYKMINSGIVMLQFNTGRGIVHHQGIYKYGM